MEFRNLTPFPGLAFQGVDQRAQSFHVAVLRQTLTWNDDAVMRFADVQLPLCEEDAPLTSEPGAPVSQESDLCHFKPRCDVIVNATGYAPTSKGGPPTNAFLIGLRVSREADVLINKVLRVHGRRSFAQMRNPQRGKSIWQLTAGEVVSAARIDLRSAWGGQCRLDPGTAEGNRFIAENGSNVQVGDHGALKWEHFAENPAGKGFLRDWYRHALAVTQIAAPEIEYAERPITARHLEEALSGGGSGLQELVAGLGVRPKGHPERAKKVGTVDDAFISSSVPLPPDFDFAVWNAAWPDQQVDDLVGDELLELVNLGNPRDGALQRDVHGNSRLALRLPGHRPFLLARFDSGAFGELPARLDTVIVEPDRRLVHLVWRAVLATAPAVRVLEYRMLQNDAVMRDQAALSTAGDGGGHGG